jgi:hypothetical protein
VVFPVGNDEHGPAYPEPYRCPTCGDGDTHSYITCNHPMCPEGRDQSPPSSVWDDPAWQEKSSPGSVWGSLLGAVYAALIIGGLLFVLWPYPAPAMNHGFDPSAPATKWFESLERPDQSPNSCCGKADAYPVDRYQKNSDHTYTVWIADGRPIKYPDGTTRDPWDITVPISVPDNKVNKEDDDLDNPTDHSWLFFRASTPTDVGTIYCFIRHPNGN